MSRSRMGSARATRAAALTGAVLALGAFSADARAASTPSELDALRLAAEADDSAPSWTAEVTQTVAARSAPRRAAAVRTVLRPQTPYSFRPAGYLATGVARDSHGRAWVRVQVPLRPNESVAWVPASAVELDATTLRIVVSLSRRRLEVWRGDRRVATHTVGIGRPLTPTPTGTFAVQDVVPTTLASDRAMYGRYVITLTAHSTVLKRFNGGPGQIALHGSGSLGRIGRPSSFGCVIVADAPLRALARIVRPGTPVVVEAG